MIPEKISRELTLEQAHFLKDFFFHCPETLALRMLLKTCPANHTLIRADDSCSYVYILLEGRLQAVEEYAPDQPYGFIELNAMDIVGDYELFTSSASRLITLTTIEKSLFLIIPAADYISWIKKDANALFIRTQMLIRQLVAQTQFERRNFTLDNRTRLLYFLFTEYSKQKEAASPVRIQRTRQEIANKLRCSSRTINRIILDLKEEGLIQLKHGKILISREQYRRIGLYLDSIFPGRVL